MIAAYPKDKDGNKLVSVPYYRVGDLFLTTIATNPSNFLGGTWKLYGPGRCLVCVDTSQSEFNSVKKTGGEKTHTLNTDEIPAHQHSLLNTNPGGYTVSWTSHSAGAQEGKGFPNNIRTTFAGGNQPHNNLQPFITCYVWIRTA